MRRPVRRRDRNATTSACVGWDDINIEKRSVLRKQAREGRLWSKRFDDHQNDDENHQYRRYLIDNTVEFLAARIPVGAKILHPARKCAMHAGQDEHEHEFGVKPG